MYVIHIISLAALIKTATNCGALVNGFLPPWRIMNMCVTWSTLRESLILTTDKIHRGVTTMLCDTIQNVSALY